MAEFTKQSFRGILVPDPNVTDENISAGDSTYTQAGNLPGVPEAQQNTEMVLQTAGVQAVDSALRIKALRGGFPVLGQGGFGWRNSTDATSFYRGCDFPTQISGWENIVDALTSSASTVIPQAARFPDLLTLANEKVVAAYSIAYAAGATTTDQRLYTKVLDTADYVWDAAVLVDGRPNLTGVSGVDCVHHPALVELPGGRILCFALLRRSASDDKAQVDMWYSDDEAVSWTLGGSNILPEGIPTTSSSAGFTLQRCRAEILNGQICLIVSGFANGTQTSTYGGEIWQYASDDYGNSFALVEQWDLGVPAADIKTGQLPDLIAAGGFLLMAYLDPALLRSFVRRTGSAFTPLSYDTATRMFPLSEAEATPSVGNPVYVTAGNVAIWLDDDGALYGMSRRPLQTGQPIQVAVSRDFGQTWAPAGYANLAEDSTNKNANLFFLYDADTYVTDYVCVAQGGRTLVAHNREAAHSPASLYKYSLAVAELGGYSTVTMPAVNAQSKATRRVGWELSWLPFEEPDNVGWTKVDTGAGAATLVQSHLRIQSGPSGADDCYFHRQLSDSTLAYGAIVMADLKVVDAPDPATDMTVILDLYVGDDSTAHGYKIRAALGEDKIVWRDLEAGSTLATTTGIDTTDGVQILMAMQETSTGVGKASTWYRILNQDAHTDDRQWIPALSNQTVTDIASSTTPQTIWGAIDGATAGVSSDSFWYGVHQVFDDDSPGQQLATGQTNPDDLFPKPFRATPMWVNAGVKVAATDGPAWHEDDWNVDTRYTYPVANLYPRQNPSPRNSWRSTVTTATQIAWKWDGPAEYENVGLMLEGINFRTGKLEGYNYAGAAWEDLIAFDTAVEFDAIHYTRIGDLLVPNVAASFDPGTRYIHQGELAGCTIDLGSSKYRKVLDNTGGLWRYGTTQYPTIRLETVDGTEPTSGTMFIWARRMLAVKTGVAATYSGFRLHIDAHTNADGYFEIGSMALGGIHLFSQDYSWARDLASRSNVEVRTARDGSRASRVWGPNRRSVAFGWREVDAAPISGFHPFPDYVMSSGDASAKAIGLRGDAILGMRNLSESLNGPDVPVVYIANMPKLQDAGTTSIKSIKTNGTSQYLAGGNVMDKERTDAFSISVWLKRDDLVRSNQEYIVRKGGIGAAGYVLYGPSANNNDLQFELENATGDTITRRTTTEPQDDLLWHHIVVTYDGTSNRTGINFYVDGIQQATADLDDASIAGSSSSSADFDVCGAGLQGWDGWIDSLTIWSKELSLAEVRKLFNHGTPGDPTVHLQTIPPGWWKMGDGDSLPTVTNSGTLGAAANLAATGSPTIETDAPGVPGDPANGVYQITSRARFLYGRLVGDVEISTVLGEEDASGAVGEVMTLGAMTLEEEV